MRPAPLPRVLTASCALWLAAAAAPSPSHAGLFRGGDDCAPNTRHTRAETDAERCNARRFESLDCRGLACYAESYRARINRQIASTYYRPVAESAPAAGVLPQLTPLPVSAPASPPAVSAPPRTR